MTQAILPRSTRFRAAPPFCGMLFCALAVGCTTSIQSERDVSSSPSEDSGLTSDGQAGTPADAHLSDAQTPDAGDAAAPLATASHSELCDNPERFDGHRATVQGPFGKYASVTGAGCAESCCCNFGGGPMILDCGDAPHIVLDPSPNLSVPPPDDDRDLLDIYHPTGWQYPPVISKGFACYGQSCFMECSPVHPDRLVSVTGVVDTPPVDMDDGTRSYSDSGRIVVSYYITRDNSNEWTEEDCPHLTEANEHDKCTGEFVCELEDEQRLLHCFQGRIRLGWCIPARYKASQMDAGMSTVDAGSQ